MFWGKNIKSNETFPLDSDNSHLDLILNITNISLSDALDNVKYYVKIVDNNQTYQICSLDKNKDSIATGLTFTIKKGMKISVKGGNRGTISFIGFLENFESEIEKEEINTDKEKDIKEKKFKKKEEVVPELKKKEIQENEIAKEDKDELEEDEEESDDKKDKLDDDDDDDEDFDLKMNEDEEEEEDDLDEEKEGKEIKDKKELKEKDVADKKEKIEKKENALDNIEEDDDDDDEEDINQLLAKKRERPEEEKKEEKPTETEKEKPKEKKPFNNNNSIQSKSVKSEKDRKNNNNNDFENDFSSQPIQNEDDNSPLCQRCKVNPEVMYLECVHPICSKCFTKYAEENFYDMKCNICHKVIEDPIKKMVLGEEKMQEIEKKALMILLGGNLVKCPSCGEQNAFEPGQIDYNVRDEKSQKITRQAAEDYAQHRCRCGFCRKDFCINKDCMAMPYHLGLTCEEFKHKQEANKCRFCDKEIKNFNRGPDDDYL